PPREGEGAGPRLHVRRHPHAVRALDRDARGLHGPGPAGARPAADRAHGLAPASGHGTHRQLLPRPRGAARRGLVRARGEGEAPQPRRGVSGPGRPARHREARAGAADAAACGHRITAADDRRDRGEEPRGGSRDGSGTVPAVRGRRVPRAPRPDLRMSAMRCAATMVLIASVSVAVSAVAPLPWGPPPPGPPLWTGATAAVASGVYALRALAAEFWAARVAGNVDAQWQLLEPRGKGRLSPAEYAGGPGAVKYLAYQVEDAKVDGFFAVVHVRILVQPLLSAVTGQAVAPAATMVEDRWVRIRGVWYRTLEQEEPQGPPQAGKG